MALAKGGGIVEARQRNILDTWVEKDDEERPTGVWWRCCACDVKPALLNKGKDVSSPFASHASA